MAVHKLSIEAFEDSAYEAIAIHTSLEPYRLAFFINKALSILLYKKTHIVDAPKGFNILECFYFEQPEIEVTWWLFENKQASNQQDLTREFGLFENEDTKPQAYVLPELKNTHFILKIEGDLETFNLEIVLKKIQEIPSISTVYTITKKQIKNKNNLIFT